MNTMANNLDIDILETAISGEAAAAASLQSFLTLQKNIFSAKLMALGQKEVEAVQFADQYVNTMAESLLNWGNDTAKSYIRKKGYTGTPRPMATPVQLQLLQHLMPSQLDHGLERIVANQKGHERRAKEDAMGVTRSREMKHGV